jgi:hypothetical protein
MNAGPPRNAGTTPSITMVIGQAGRGVSENGDGCAACRRSVRTGGSHRCRRSLPPPRWRSTVSRSPSASFGRSSRQAAEARPTGGVGGHREDPDVTVRRRTPRVVRNCRTRRSAPVEHHQSANVRGVCSLCAAESTQKSNDRAMSWVWWSPGSLLGSGLKSLSSLSATSILGTWRARFDSRLEGAGANECESVRR